MIRIGAHTELLRRYALWECGNDGYPMSWHRPSAFSEDGCRYYNLPDSETAIENCGKIVTRHPPIKDLIREEAAHRCQRCGHPYPPGITETCPRGEWTPCDVYCSHGEPVRYRDEPITQPDGATGVYVWKEAHWRILTVHHLNEDKADCRWWNLAALCQRCQLRMQRAVVMGRPYHYEHSEWFKPYAAGFYAWKYEGVDLSREQTLERLDELLAYEHKFTQDALL